MIRQIILTFAYNVLLIPITANIFYLIFQGKGEVLFGITGGLVNKSFSTYVGIRGYGDAFR